VGDDINEDDGEDVKSKKTEGDGVRSNTRRSKRKTAKTTEELQQTSDKKVACTRAARAAASPEKRQEHLARQRTARAAASPEKRQKRLDADAAQHRVSRAAASPEKRQERLHADAAQQQSQLGS
jgi:hypothetical protein